MVIQVGRETMLKGLKVVGVGQGGNGAAGREEEPVQRVAKVDSMVASVRKSSGRAGAAGSNRDATRLLRRWQ